MFKLTRTSPEDDLSREIKINQNNNMFKKKRDFFNEGGSIK